MRQITRFLFSAGMTALLQLCVGQLAVGQTIDEERKESLSKMGLSQIPNPEAILKEAEALFALPIDQQSLEALRELAKTANMMANLIGNINEEYEGYRRDNYRYDFVTEKVDPTMDKYTKEGNKFKSIRNQVYFNIGSKLAADGQDLMAFLYFRDAFRLSTFDCGLDGVERCMRWKAEQEMQKLLGLSHIKAFVTWQ